VRCNFSPAHMGQIKKPIRISTEEIGNEPEKKGGVVIVESKIDIREHPVVKLLNLYLEKRELLDDYDERKIILDLIKSLAQPKFLFQEGKLPIEEDFLQAQGDKK
jgi:hypothetical protein